MPDVTRGGPGSMAGVAFYDVDSINVFSFCPDSNDASTPATQVHVHITMKDATGRKQAPMVMRCFGPDTLDGLIEALIEHRTYVFGRREFHSNYPEQR
jgi:hypothetical protein